MKCKVTVPLLAALLMTTSGFSEEKTLETDQLVAQSSKYNSRPSHAPSIEDEMWGWYFSGEALFWQTQVNGPSFAQANSSTSFNIPYTSGLSPIDFNWDWGLKVGTGGFFDDRNWGINAEFTYFSSQAKNSVNPPGGGGIRIPFNLDFTTIFGANAFAASAKSNFKFRLRAIDGVIERKFDVGYNVTLYPQIGVKGLWIDEKQKVTYQGGGLGEQSYIVKEDIDCKGVGPRVALRTKWIFGYGFGMYGNAAGSMVFNRYEDTVRRNYTLGGDFNTRTDMTRRGYAIPIVEAEVGFSFDYEFSEVAQMLSFHAGFETQQMFNAHQSIIRVNEIEYFDITVYGVTLGGAWLF